MNWFALLNWVNDPTRTDAELQMACNGLGIPVALTRVQMIADLNALITTHVMTNPATWTPPAPAPAPAPVPAPAPAGSNNGPNWTGIAAAVAVVAAILFAVLFFTKDDDGNATTTATTPTTTVTATDSSTPTDTTTSGATDDAVPVNVPNSTCIDHEMMPGDTYQVPAGCNIKGDVQASSTNGNFTALYDSDPTTGLLVSCPQGCWIFAEWGANVTERAVDDLTSEMTTSGCTGGCASVKNVTWPENNATNRDSSNEPQPGVDSSSVSPCDFSIPQGAVAYVPKNCVVAGDIEVSDFRDSGYVALYDSDQNTGLVTIADQDIWIKAPWGASVSDSNVDDVVRSVDLTGCGLPDGCKTVNVKHAA